MSTRLKSSLHDTRLSPPVLRARLAAGPDGHQHLLAPAVGLFRGALAPGELALPDQPIGVLEILGVAHHVLAPAGAGGLVLGEDTRVLAPTRVPVGFDDLLLALDPDATAAAAAAASSSAAVAGAATATGATVFCAPTSGRFYGRAGPGKPVFVSVGAILEHGQTVGLIEVMKTFSRVLYGGDRLPVPARVLRLLVADETDISQGDPLLEVEPLEASGDQNTKPHPA